MLQALAQEAEEAMAAAVSGLSPSASDRSPPQPSPEPSPSAAYEPAEAGEAEEDIDQEVRPFA